MNKQSIANIVRLFVPPFFYHIKRKMSRDKNVIQYGYFGDYSSFAEADRLCSGYSANNIVKKILESTLRVKNGDAAFERDGVIFDKVQYSFPLLVSLFKVAAWNNNKLNVLDFGGSLGNHFFQNRHILSPIEIEQWTVVEQSHYVNIGNMRIADDKLCFKESIDDVSDSNVLLISSVIQYLEDPYGWVEKLIHKGIDYMIFDRLQLNVINKDRITIQKVPPDIYEATYPSWFLNEEKFLSLFNEKYILLEEFDCIIDKTNIPSKSKAFLFKKIL